MQTQQPTSIDVNRFVRNSLIRNPTAEFEDVVKEWDRLKYPASLRPTSRNIVHSSRYSLKVKYGVGAIGLLPKSPIGDVSVSGLVKLLLKKRPGLTERQCAKLVEADGFEMNSGVYANAVKNNRAEGDSKIEPRNRLNGLNGSVVSCLQLGTHDVANCHDSEVRGKHDASHDEPSDASYREIEAVLDDLVHHAREISDGPLVELLRKARAHVIKSQK